MQLKVMNMAGDEVNSIDLPADIFEANVNVGLMHQAVVRQLSNARRGTHKAKGRSEISRTGAKIYRQKGTGNARHGSRRAPIFVGGGVAHGPQVRDYSKKMPRKMRRAALRSALTVKASEGNIMIIDQIDMDQPKTKEMAAMIGKVVGVSNVLMVIPGRNENVERSTRNLAETKAIHAPYLNVRDVLGHEKLVFSLDALEVVTDLLSTGKVFEEEGEA